MSGPSSVADTLGCSHGAYDAPNVTVGSTLDTIVARNVRKNKEEVSITGMLKGNINTVDRPFHDYSGVTHAQGFFTGAKDIDARHGAFTEYNGSVVTKHLGPSTKQFNGPVTTQYNGPVTHITQGHYRSFRRDHITTKILMTLKPANRELHSVPGCMPGTRKHIFDEIDRWLDDFNEPNVLWLRGCIGAGKSAVASSMVFKLIDRGRLGSYFFFRRGHATLGDPASLWRTVACDLAERNFKFAKEVDKALKLMGADLRESYIGLHFEYLIRKPLEVIDHHTPPVIVIDAIDECGSEDSQSTTRKALLDTLVKWHDLPKIFKLIVTGRAGDRIPNSFQDYNCCKQIELRTGHNVNEETNEDIRLYIGEHLPDFTYFPEPRRQGIIQQLTARAAGLFIWAKIVVGILMPGFTDEQLNRISHGDLGEETLLFRLYHQLLDSLFPKGIVGRNREIYTVVVSAVVFAKVPLHREDLHLLLSKPSNAVQDILTKLSSVISVGEDDCLRTVHLSFCDFLCNSKCPEAFRIDRENEMQRFAKTCLVRMKEGLKFNICGLETSYLRNDQVENLSERVRRKVSGSLLYCCRYWAAHLRDTVDHGTLLVEVKEFLHHHFLFWLEVMSLVNDVSAANIALLTLVPWIEERDKQLSTFAKDASRFIVNFDIPISTSVPHIYLSALPFSPSESLVAQRYHSLFPHTLSVISGRDVDWPALVNIFRGHTGAVRSVAFSKDGRRVVSGSDDKTIQIWDAETSQITAGPFQDHDSSVRSVSFSPDGKAVVSGSEDKEIRIRNVDTDPVSRSFSVGHKGAVTSLAFSRDGTKVVSGSEDKTIRIWNVVTGHVIAGPFESTGAVISVAFSPDDKRVVLSTSDWPIQIRDVETGSVISSLFGALTEQFISIALSKDGKYIVSGSSDGTVRIWDVKTGHVIAGPFEGHEEAVYAVAFTRDGRRVVSGYADNTIRIWDVTMNQTREIVTSPVDRTVTVWDIESSLDSSPRHTNKLLSVGGPQTLTRLCGNRADGWLRCNSDTNPETHDQPLFYVPQPSRDGLCGIETMVVFGAHPTQVDFSRFEHGKSWENCCLPLRISSSDMSDTDCSVLEPDHAEASYIRHTRTVVLVLVSIIVGYYASAISNSRA